MKSRYLLLASSIAIINFSSFAAVNEIDFETTHPQILSLSTPENNDVTLPNGIIRTTKWRVNSNNAVEVSFSGVSPFEDLITSQNLPIFYKQEVDARGNLVAGEYDYLTTNFGVMISDYDSTGKSSNYIFNNDLGLISLWGGGELSFSDQNEDGVIDGAFVSGFSGTPLNLVNDSTPNQMWGVIMPNDEGHFFLSLHSKGSVESIGTQSGRYSMTVFLNISANEQL
ncbi:MAG: hypothetical protein NZ811_06725 [Gammaproteobacteria bacterium]|nr:hypothetical protein [Gammaproteobacteria bacterium]